MVDDEELSEKTDKELMSEMYIRITDIEYELKLLKRTLNQRGLL